MENKNNSKQSKDSPKENNNDMSDDEIQSDKIDIDLSKLKRWQHFLIVWIIMLIVIFVPLFTSMDSLRGVSGGALIAVAYALILPIVFFLVTIYAIATSLTLPMALKRFKKYPIVGIIVNLLVWVFIFIILIFLLRFRG